MSYDRAREQMLSQLTQGAQACKEGDASNKVILCRGCDPVMAERAMSFMPKLLGNVQMVATTDDDAFLAALQARKYDAVHFAPGACRWSSAKRPIPGGNQMTAGWSLEQYRALVRQYQGSDVPIVETEQEAQCVPLLRAALNLPG